MGNIMVPLKKFLSNKNTITILGVLIGVVVLYVGYNWRVTKSIQPVSVPISATTISPFLALFCFLTNSKPCFNAKALDASFSSKYPSKPDIPEYTNIISYFLT